MGRPLAVQSWVGPCRQGLYGPYGGYPRRAMAVGPNTAAASATGFTVLRSLVIRVWGLGLKVLDGEGLGVSFAARRAATLDFGFWV